MSNQVTLSGYIASGFTYSHTLYGENFYNVFLSINRSSGNVDLIPLMVSDRLIDVSKEYINQYVHITGQFRSYNQHEENKNTLKLYVFVSELTFTEDSRYINDVFLEGYLCKTPTYRYTPNSREVSDVLLAVNRSYNKSDYIPCICWGRTAYYVKSLGVGDHVRVAGRIQSRKYTKGGEIKTAYELSINLLELC